MVAIVWTEQAYLDLKAIFEYINCDSGKYAQLVVEKILNAIKRLEIFPESGRIVPERNEKHIREVLVGNYRVIYSLRTDSVAILTIRHGAARIDFTRLS